MLDAHEAGWMEYWRLSLPEREAYNRLFPNERPTAYWTDSSTLAAAGIKCAETRADVWVRVWAIILIDLLEIGLGTRLDAAQEKLLWREATANEEWRAAFMAVWSLGGGTVGNPRIPKNAKAPLRAWVRKNLPKRYAKVAEDEDL